MTATGLLPFQLDAKAPAQLAGAERKGLPLRDHVISERTDVPLSALSRCVTSPRSGPSCLPDAELGASDNTAGA